ncbi:SoxR reducing system RseC family protein [Vibrio sp. JC009]|uniref:SoxR reducing system RseC family protein n=1 Tax=Vibrio sp. JC009 TaxID=2912314 RepID=UPI0023AE80FC|nr:SoxR reducing system RseC family protein [Vibrio sp. JC009]WED22242.1 SoxR reducing system RseC family protein [Vibrio sp. JC009]
MITALATVVSVEATDEGNRLELSCEQQTSCSHCSSRSSCGTGIVSKAVGNKSHRWVLTTSKSVKAGQTVEIGLSERNLVQYASVVYLLPIFALILGAAIAELYLAPMLSMGEGLIIGVAILFMSAGILLAKQIAKSLQAKSQQSVSLIRVLGETLETGIN